MPHFLVDAQLPPAIARKPTALGHETVHVLDVGLLDVDDSRIWDYALGSADKQSRAAPVIQQFRPHFPSHTATSIA